MNYGLFSRDLMRTYGERYTPPYWQYTVVPRNYEEPVYRASLDFASPEYLPLSEFFLLNTGDILEVFLLENRMLVTGVQVEIREPAEGVVLQPVTRSGVYFDPINCFAETKAIYAPFGGRVGRTTNLATHSFRVEEPDYLGFRIVSGAFNLIELAIDVTLGVSDTFSLDTPSNSSKGEQWIP